MLNVYKILKNGKKCKQELKEKERKSGEEKECAEN
jgi:hypothetical protein